MRRDQFQPPKGAFTHSVPVRFSHCDLAGIVYFPHYFDMFNGLIEDWYGEELGYDYANLITNSQYAFPFVHIECDFKIPSRMVPVREKVDALLKLNNDYAKWTAGATDEKTAKLYAFIHASTWADDIKTKEYHYARDDVDNPTAGQNIGNADHHQHAYWHYRDVDFSPDGTPLPAAAPVDLVTQAKLMIAALPASSGASDDVRSYDLVWLLHLVGDAHQPLHAIARFTKQIPNGDAGGNRELVIPATSETIALHAYWDREFGGYSSPHGAVFDADNRDELGSVSVNEAAAKISDPEAWIEESAELAKQYGYASPVSTAFPRQSSNATTFII